MQTRTRAGRRVPGFVGPSLKAARSGVLAVLLAGLAFLAATVPAGAQAVSPETGSRQFLAFPSSDPEVKVTQGWYYDAVGLKSILCSNPRGDIPGYGRHCAIDYRKSGERQPNGKRRNVTFAVTAAAGGYAYRRSPGSGTIVRPETS